MADEERTNWGRKDRRISPLGKGLKDIILMNKATLLAGWL
jgi:hypothetical protein